MRRTCQMLGGLVGAIAVATSVVPALGAARHERRIRHPGRVPRAVAYVRQSAFSKPFVWVLSPPGAGGRRHRLGPGNLPLVSPDGATVATATGPSASGKVLLYPTSGGPAVKVGGPAVKVGLTASAEATPLAWSPDSRYLAVSLISTAIHGIKGAGLAVIDTSTGGYTIVADGVVSGATFAGDGSDSVIYGLATSLRLKAPVNLYESSPTSHVSSQLTHDGHSLHPVWTRKGIVFDRERFRGISAGRAYQLWLLSGRSHKRPRRLTRMRIPPLLDGLVPLNASADGNRLLAEYEGQDTSYAWTVQLHPLRLRPLTIRGKDVQGGTIARDGRSVLVDSGAFMAPADRGTVETVPFSGRGRVVKLARGGSPTGNL